MSGSLTPGLNSLTGKFFSTTTKTVSSTTETSIIPAGVGDLIVPGGWFQPGYNLRIIARGTVTTALVAGTATMRVKFGGVTVATAVTTSLLGGISNQFFKVIANIQCYTAGTAGQFGLAGEISYPSGLAGLQPGVQIMDNTNIAADTSQPILFDVTSQWSLASHSLKTSIFTAELMQMV